MYVLFSIVSQLSVIHLVIGYSTIAILTRLKTSIILSYVCAYICLHTLYMSIGYCIDGGWLVKATATLEGCPDGHQTNDGHSCTRGLS